MERKTIFGKINPSDMSFPQEAKRAMQDSYRESIMSRMSILSRSNHAGPINNSHPIKETRPINDKKYQRETIVKICDFVKEFHPHVNAKLLSSPSPVLYAQLFEILYRYFDSLFTLPPKFDPEYIIKALKNLGYPYSVQKSTLSCQGSFISWIHALSALRWMIEIIEATQSIPFCFNFKKDINPIGEKMLMDKVDIMMEGFKSRTYNLDEIFVSHLKTYEKEANIEFNEHETKALDNELQILQLKVDEFDRLRKQLADLEIQKMELSLYEQQCKTRLPQLKDKQIEKSHIIMTLANRVESEMEGVKELSEKLNHQILNKTDKTYLAKEEIKVDMELETLKREVGVLETNLNNEHTIEMKKYEKANHLCSDLNMKLLTYHFDTKPPQLRVQDIIEENETPKVLQTYLTTQHEKLYKSLSEERDLQDDCDKKIEKQTLQNTELANRIEETKSHLEKLKTLLISKKKMFEIQNLDLVKAHDELQSEAGKLEKLKKEHYDYLVEISKLYQELEDTQREKNNLKAANEYNLQADKELLEIEKENVDDMIQRYEMKLELLVYKIEDIKLSLNLDRKEE